MRATTAILVATVLLLCGAGVEVQAQTTQGGSQPVSTAPTDKASFFSHADMENIWKDLETRKVINKRVLEGGSHSVNIRIVTEDAAPLVHSTFVDVWVVIEGTATAITGGQLVDAVKTANADDQSGSSIRGGVEQPMRAGDVVVVPTGVPHGFKDIKGFHAVLIRFEAK